MKRIFLYAILIIIGGNGFAGGMQDFRLNNSLACLSPDNKKLLFVSDNEDPVKIWNTETGSLLYSFPVRGEVTALTFSPDSQYAAAGVLLSREPVYASLSIWNTAAGELTAFTDSGISIFLKFNEDARSLSFGTYYINCWEEWFWESGEIKKLPERLIDQEHRSEKPDESLAVNKDLGIIVRVGREMGMPLVVQEIVTERELQTVRIDSSLPVRVLFFTETGDRLLTLHSGGKSEVLVWNPENWEIITRLEVEGFISQGCISSDSSLLFLHIYPYTGEIWSLETLSLRNTFSLRLPEESLYAAAENGDLELVKEILLQENLELDREIGSYASTALMAAAYRGHADIVSMLLEAGADPAPVNWQGKTALDIACDILHALENRTNQGSDPAISMQIRNQKRLISLLENI